MLKPKARDKKCRN
ncbi:hypothetical protein IEO21_08701 [Rhodonia placenta]|uniref:Uncharacterized protein n=1 Tax=Rhodonia placenta TaxID=104341 RepID=A0A8H7TYG2_9APHY|nr:hypothetical protein IEO21_08701 [Postia placenta]